MCVCVFVRKRERERERTQTGQYLAFVLPTEMMLMVEQLKAMQRKLDVLKMATAAAVT